MNDHESISTRLDDYVDGLLDSDDTAAARRHLAECLTCRREVEATRRLQEAAKSLPSALEPPRDLWAGIAARIGAAPGAALPAPAPATPETDAGEADGGRVRVIRIDTRRPTRQSWWMRRDLLAAAAMILVLLSSALTAALLRGGAGAGGGAIAAGGAAADGAALVAFQPAEAELLGVAEQLRFALDAQRESLDPATVAVVEENLGIIEHAIGEARAALDSDPNNRDLTFLLIDMYMKKVDLLQDVLQSTST